MSIADKLITIFNNNQSILEKKITASQKYPILIHIDGYYDVIAPSGMTWGEIYALGIYEWLKNENGDGCYNIEEFAGINPGKNPYDGMVLNYENQGRFDYAPKFKVQFTNGTFEFPFEEGMTWNDYIGTSYSDESGIDWYSEDESMSVAYNNVELVGMEGTEYGELEIRSTLIYTCDTSYGDDSGDSGDKITIYINGKAYSVPEGMTFYELMEAGEIPENDHYCLDDGNYEYITWECPVEGEYYTHTSV